MATISFTNVIESVKDFLVTQITEVDSTTASVSDIDAVIDGILADETKTAGLVVDFLYSVPHGTDSGRRVNDLWDTFLAGIILIEYQGREDTEADKNEILDMLMRAFDTGSSKVMVTANGTNDRVSIVRIERPQKMNILDRPFYYLPFTLKVNHGGKA